MSTLDLPTPRAYPCPTCGAETTNAAFHADRNRRWYDFLCPVGHVFQLSLPPAA